MVLAVKVLDSQGKVMGVIIPTSIQHVDLDLNMYYPPRNVVQNVSVPVEVTAVPDEVTGDTVSEDEVL